MSTFLPCSGVDFITISVFVAGTTESTVPYIQIAYKYGSKCQFSAGHSAVLFVLCRAEESNIPRKQPVNTSDGPLLLPRDPSSVSGLHLGELSDFCAVSTQF